MAKEIYVNGEEYIGKEDFLLAEATFKKAPVRISNFGPFLTDKLSGRYQVLRTWDLDGWEFTLVDKEVFGFSICKGIQREAWFQPAGNLPYQYIP